MAATFIFSYIRFVKCFIKIRNILIHFYTFWGNLIEMVEIVTLIKIVKTMVW